MIGKLVRLAAITLLSYTQASATGGLISGLNNAAPVQHLTIVPIMSA